MTAAHPDPLSRQAMADEFEALDALSDAELAERGLTRTVLRRHLRQKHRAVVPLDAHEVAHDRDPARD